MFQGIILNLVISFIVKQLEKFGDSLNWEKVKQDAEERIRKLMPGTWFDDEAAYVVNLVLAGVQEALEDADKFRTILKLLADKKYPEAFSAVKEFLLELWQDLQNPHISSLKAHL
jgi:hypothetical protein